MRASRSVTRTSSPSSSRVASVIAWRTAGSCATSSAHDIVATRAIGGASPEGRVAMESSIMAQSATLRASGPMQSSRSTSAISPSFETTPCVGFRPAMPQ
jgi:hypothetical protein